MTTKILLPRKGRCGVSKYKESFGKWFNPFDEKMGQASKVEAIQYTFEHQQSKINELLERLKECESALKFYADKNNYIELCVEGSTGNPRITEGDFVDCVIDHADRGYAKAREYFKKYEGLYDNK